MFVIFLHISRGYPLLLSSTHCPSTEGIFPSARWEDPFTSWREFTWFQFLPALGLKEGVTPGISCQLGSDTAGNISMHERELEVCLKTKPSEAAGKPQRQREIFPAEPTHSHFPSCFRNTIFLLFALSAKPSFV